MCYNLIVYIKVKVFPKSKKDNLLKIKDDYFEVRVKDKAEKNLANKKVMCLLSDFFAIETKKIKIINGHRSPSKLISIDVD